MSAQHTPGRLAIDDGYPRIAKAADGRDFFLAHEYGNAEANARRLVACWNALIDLPQEALDGGWTRAGLEAHALKVEQQRDELLAALKRINGMCAAPPNFSDATIQEVARAAIAKVEGGAA